jgi:hypothetical protein
MFLRSSQWVQWTAAISAGSMRSVPAPALPNSGFIASGVSPRQPATHSELPSAPPRYGLGTVALEPRPSSHLRLSQFCHFGFEPSVTSM